MMKLHLFPRRASAGPLGPPEGAACCAVPPMRSCQRRLQVAACYTWSTARQLNRSPFGPWFNTYSIGILV